ncbi:tRNA threonylcarbamoyladenosine biosynthesis protein TsaE [Litoreibacter ascidiaceicola]|uniref:tRNA threonylcarbamoyladenosine biosynthesis protein TsaE n=1 Tax=Litoreibacter ascidiaceicola TaxID=1486859 RepID=A0A1M5AYG7_9RHOB|nr:tRNA (adenosine(37)-N6)-threonylcarbamoyltransferase complex ATPase subunit type 1 TsaE [Litoreibacter ascidiaceicola]SHF35278.1 tRNA threonylcarbamoyladenosine biosynthesis protein TsaE [Litoreibacter ascidiaceicola]
MTSPAPSRHKAGAPRSVWTADLASPDATASLAHAFAAIATPGLCVLINGPVGAGKSFFARNVIQTLMAQKGALEDVPSPTFTLVQTYELGPLDVWHADLYRLTDAGELIELGLEQAFDSALCLIEWPDRLGSLRPDGAVELTMTPDPNHQDRRHVRIDGPTDLITRLSSAMEIPPE